MSGALSRTVAVIERGIEQGLHPGAQLHVAVVSGHLHRPGTRWRDGVRFEEVSFGYPQERTMRAAPGLRLREVLPGPVGAAVGAEG